MHAAGGGLRNAAVAAAMGITTILAVVLARSKVRWTPWIVTAVFGPLMFIDVVYVAGNVTKFAQGAWLPLLVALVLFSLFMAWRFGRPRLRSALRAAAVPLKRLPG